MTNIITVGQ